MSEIQAADVDGLRDNGKSVLQRLKPPHFRNFYVVAEATTYKDSRVLTQALQVAQVSERTSDAPANCVSRSLRRVMAKFKDVSATRTGA